MSFAEIFPAGPHRALSLLRVLRNCERVRIVAAACLLTACSVAVPASATDDGLDHESPVAVAGSYTLDLSGFSGGQTSGRGFIARGLFEVGLDIDLGRPAGGSRGALHVGVHAFRGGNGSDRVGDVHGFSNIDASRFEDMAEIWYEQRLLGNRLRLKAGRIDANSEFAAVESASEFLNSSAGFSPTISHMPTYPHPEPGVGLFARPSRRLQLAFGLFGSPAEGLFTIAEAGVEWTAGRADRAHRLVLGGWRDSSAVPGFDGRVDRGIGGSYLLFEQRREGTRERGGQSWFFQLGRADERVSQVALHWSVGWTRSGFGRRSRDAMGMLASVVDLSDVPDAGFESDETALEVYYKLALKPWLSLRPDLQYVIDPSGDRQAANALIGTLRIELTL